MINFSKAVKQFDLIVENGPLGTRLKYDYGYDVSFELPSKKAGRRALTKLYEGDIAVAKTHHLPIIVNALTFRASRNHIKAAGFVNSNILTRINSDAIKVTKDIQAKHTGANTPIFVGAPLGSMYDAYSTAIMPSVEEAKHYHAEQITIVNNLTVNFESSLKS